MRRDGLSSFHSILVIVCPSSGSDSRMPCGRFKHSPKRPGSRQNRGFAAMPCKSLPRISRFVHEPLAYEMQDKSSFQLLIPSTQAESLPPTLPFCLWDRDCPRRPVRGHAEPVTDVPGDSNDLGGSESNQMVMSFTGLDLPLFLDLSLIAGGGLLFFVTS